MRYGLHLARISAVFMCNCFFISVQAQTQEMPPIPEVTSKEQAVTQPSAAEPVVKEKKPSAAATPTVLRVKKMENNLFSMELRDVEIGDLLRVLAHDYNLNIIMDRKVKGRVTASFSNISLDEALARILENNNLAYKKMGNVIKVTPCLITKTFVLKYLQAKNVINPPADSDTSDSGTGMAVEEDSSQQGQYGSDASDPTSGSGGGSSQAQSTSAPGGAAPAPQAGASSSTEQPKNNTIYDLLSPDGKIFFDNEANSIMVIDYPENLKSIGKYLSKVDVLPRQVLIEAKIVEVKLQKEHSLGVNWKAFMEKGSLPIGAFRLGSLSTLGNAPAPLEQAIGYKSTVYPPTQTTGTVENPFTISIFDENINIVLKTLAAVLDTDILSAPRVTTVNNREAKIEMIQRYPWAEPKTDVAGQSGSVSTSWKVNYEDLGIILLATPTINDDGTITLILNPEVTERTGDITLKLTQGTTSIDYAVPIIDKRAASTKVVVGNGQTLILGGLIKDKVTKGETKVPFIGDIPYFGYFFKSTKETRDKTELLIFVSPTIITRQKAMPSENLPVTYWNPSKESDPQQKIHTNITPAKKIIALKTKPVKQQTKVAKKPLAKKERQASIIKPAKPVVYKPEALVSETKTTGPGVYEAEAPFNAAETAEPVFYEAEEESVSVKAESETQVAINDKTNKDREINKILTLLDEEAATKNEFSVTPANSAASASLE